MLSNDGLKLLDVATGEVRLDYNWPYIGYRAVQPHVVGASSILVPTGNGAGTRRIEVLDNADGLSAKVTWTSKSLKPDFNDFVTHEGHAYGYDNKIIACIDLATGKLMWKGGRYGKGQLMLLADSELLLVQGESGDVILLKADPAKHQELATLHALNGKTWNHPVVVSNRLYVRNAEEAGCWELPTADRGLTEAALQQATAGVEW
jgi:hypothetical protein